MRKTKIKNRATNKRIPTKTGEKNRKKTKKIRKIVRKKRPNEL